MTSDRELHVPSPDGMRLPLTNGESQPTANGAILYAMVLPEQLKTRVDALAKERGCIAADVLLTFAIQGERCDRNHEKQDGAPRP